MIDYEAISYTWASNVGEIEWTECITLDRREFLVTPKCMMALRLVRSRGAEKAIWMDAVCMNQKDAEERGHQVRLMPRIFSRAQHVLIYVGEPAPEEERLLQILHGDPISTMPLQPLQVALETFLQRPYFSRAWVLQEVALAKMATLVCGKFSMPWSIVQISQLAKRGLLVNAKEKPRLLNMLSCRRFCSSARHRIVIRATSFTSLIWHVMVAQRIPETSSSPYSGLFPAPTPMVLWRTTPEQPRRYTCGWRDGSFRGSGCPPCS
ncbi:heterokaryon incompatibility protein [Colletotrichum graminicola]|nr:heterokaryon incompatibility protein [Colletotrichum graminicola]